jgi:hypothetical protein
MTGKRALCISASLSAIAYGSVAMAQPTDVAVGTAAAPEADASTIVVTARRRAEDVSKVPVSVTAFSGDMLVRKSVQSTFDLTRLTPGLNIGGSGTMANPVIAIRGQMRKPTYDFGGYFESEYGRFNSLRIEGAINLPIIADKIALRVAAQSYSTDGFTKTFVYEPYSLTGPFAAAPGALRDNANIVFSGLFLGNSLVYRLAEGCDRLRCGNRHG